MPLGIDRWRQLHSRTEWLVGRTAPCHENIEHEVGCHSCEEDGPVIWADINRPLEERRVDASAKIHRRAPRLVDRRTLRHPEIRPWRVERTRAGGAQRQPQ